MFSLTEILTLDVNNEINGVTETEPKLWQYSFYPELFLVDANFCEVWNKNFLRLELNKILKLVASCL